MSLTLHLDVLLERKLKSVALRSGTSSQKLVIDALKDRLARESNFKPRKRPSIGNLLEEISRGMTEEEWTRYALLSEKRRKETLKRKELAELCAFSDRLEKLSARRVELVVELARRRGTAFDTEWKKLGLEPRHV